MFAVAFCVTFATAFGGYTALHVAPVALAYSLSVKTEILSLRPLSRAHSPGWALDLT
jgi:hypothetical protein